MTKNAISLSKLIIFKYPNAKFDVITILATAHINCKTVKIKAIIILESIIFLRFSFVVAICCKNPDLVSAVI